jgi:hypothetical protein
LMLMLMLVLVLVLVLQIMKRESVVFKIKSRN